MVGKMWNVKETRLKMIIDISGGKTIPTRRMNIMMRVWVDIKASKHKTTLS
jgi:hypothetical protein